MPIIGLAVHLHLLFVQSLSACHVDVNSYWSALHTFNYSMPHNTIWPSIKGFLCLPCSNSPWFSCIIWCNVFCSLTDAFMLQNCSVTFWLMEVRQLLIMACVLGNAFRCDQNCYWADQGYIKRKQYNRLAEEKSGKLSNWNAPQLVLLQEHLLRFFIVLSMSDSLCYCKCWQVDSNKCPVCLLTWVVPSTSAPLDSWNMSYFPVTLCLASRLPLLSFFSSTSQPPGKSVCGSEMGCEWSPQQFLDRPCIPPSIFCPHPSQHLFPLWLFLTPCTISLPDLHSISESVWLARQFHSTAHTKRAPGELGPDSLLLCSFTFWLLWGPYLNSGVWDV